MSVLTGPHTILLLPLTRPGKGPCSTMRTHCSLERPPESVSLAYGLGGDNPAQAHWPEKQRKCSFSTVGAVKRHPFHTQQQQQQQ